LEKKGNGRQRGKKTSYGVTLRNEKKIFKESRREARWGARGRGKGKRGIMVGRRIVRQIYLKKEIKQPLARGNEGEPSKHFRGRADWKWRGGPVVLERLKSETRHERLGKEGKEVLKNLKLNGKKSLDSSHSIKKPPTSKKRVRKWFEEKKSIRKGKKQTG